MYIPGTFPKHSIRLLLQPNQSKRRDILACIWYRAKCTRVQYAVVLGPWGELTVARTDVLYLASLIYCPACRNSTTSAWDTCASFIAWKQHNPLFKVTSIIAHELLRRWLSPENHVKQWISNKMKQRCKNKMRHVLYEQPTRCPRKMCRKSMIGRSSQ